MMESIDCFDVGLIDHVDNNVNALYFRDLERLNPVFSIAKWRKMCVLDLPPLIKMECRWDKFNSINGFETSTTIPTKHDCVRLDIHDTDHSLFVEHAGRRNVEPDCRVQHFVVDEQFEHVAI